MKPRYRTCSSLRVNLVCSWSCSSPSGRWQTVESSNSSSTLSARNPGEERAAEASTVLPCPAVPGGRRGTLRSTPCPLTPAQDDTFLGCPAQPELGRCQQGTLRDTLGADQWLTLGNSPPSLWYSPGWAEAGCETPPVLRPHLPALLLPRAQASALWSRDPGHPAGLCCTRAHVQQESCPLEPPAPNAPSGLV